jgi:small-conductance mechanosensitive channel/CRP-like cAMP-binding protein
MFARAMPFLTDILQEALDARSLYLAGALVITIALLRALKSEGRKSVRGMVLVYLSHLVLLPVTAALRAGKSSFLPECEFLLLFLGAVSGIQIGSAIAFDVLGPMIRIRAPRILRDIVGGFASAVAVFVVLSHFTDTSKLFATSALVTAVIGFSLQDTLGNIMGGISLQLDNTVAIGDWIKIGDPLTGSNGRVVDIRWRYTAIETRNWETIIVPNSVLMKGQVTILGRRTDKPLQWRRWVWFNVDYRFAPTQVISIAEQAVRAAPIANVSSDPAPNAVCMDFADSYARYALRYWLTDLAPDDPTDSVVRQRIYFALKRAGITIAIPAVANFATIDDTTRRKAKAEHEHEHRLEALRKVDLFNHLAEEDRVHLADRLVPAPFARNETLTKQGAEAHWLYMITAGEVSVRVTVDGGLEREVARLRDGSFFGEMSLMTGAPRSATVVALTDVECYKLDSHAFREIIQRKPELAEEVAAILAKRRVELEAVKEGLNDDTKRRRMASAKSDLLDSIRAFFGLAEEPVGVQ